MLRRVLKYIRDKELLEKGSRVLVAVSGGADSVALLDVLVRGGYEVVVAHCNFHLRGEESNRDENFVRELVTRINARPDKELNKRPEMETEVEIKKEVKLYVKEFDTKAYAEETGKSIEMAARDLRYDWFMALAEDTGCTAVAVAHHQNDQAETVLLNLKRCPGLRGLQGMRAKMYRNGSAIPVIRPLLCTTHNYIEHYLRDIRHLGWVEDSTNKDERIKRNGIRAMLSTWPKAEIEHIAETAEMIQGYVDWIEGKESPEAKEIEKYEKTRYVNGV